jgi:hypothetical protein
MRGATRSRASSHLIDQLERGRGEQLGILAAQRDRQRAAAGTPAALRAEADTGIGDLEQVGASAG